MGKPGAASMDNAGKIKGLEKFKGLKKSREGYKQWDWEKVRARDEKTKSRAKGQDEKTKHQGEL